MTHATNTRQPQTRQKTSLYVSSIVTHSSVWHKPTPSSSSIPTDMSMAMSHQAWTLYTRSVSIIDSHAFSDTIDHSSSISDSSESSSPSLATPLKYASIVRVLSPSRCSIWTTSAFADSISVALSHEVCFARRNRNWRLLLIASVHDYADVCVWCVCRL